MKTKILSSKKILSELLTELWQNAIFDKDSYLLLENYVTKKLAEKKDFDEKKLLDELATVRNRNLISSSFQKKMQETTVAFFGLSVGSHAALTWSMQSRANHIKISDPDTISPTNLNRLRFGWESVGQKKVDVVKKALRAINPYIKVDVLTTVDKKSMRKFLEDAPQPTIIIDAIDDMDGKILLRQIAQERGLVLLSAADVGDNVVLDIERYDKKPFPKMFLGRIPNIDSINFSELSDRERRNMVIKLVGFEKNSIDMLESLNALGKSLATWPQLGATATIAGGVICTTIKKIILGEAVASGRYYISLDDILVPQQASSLTKIKTLISHLQKKLKLE